jgi:protein-L-isoaspartate(D-aspartate) O-methyltransferase
MPRRRITGMNSVDDSFRTMPRELFLPVSVRSQALMDHPLPIGYGQTNSQPTTVRNMLEWLDVQPGQRVLDVGSGSGWTTALLSVLVGKRGHVAAVEVVPELVAFGESNCRKAGVKNATFHQAGLHYGLPKAQPFDRILVSASADTLPKELLDQLVVGGKLVIPVQYDVLEITKQLAEPHLIKAHPGYIFVPLI